MRQGISVEYVRYLTGRSRGVWPISAHCNTFFGSSALRRLAELILLGTFDTPEAVQNLIAFLNG